MKHFHEGFYVRDVYDVPDAMMAVMYCIQGRRWEKLEDQDSVIELTEESHPLHEKKEAFLNFLKISY